MKNKKKTFKFQYKNRVMREKAFNKQMAESKVLTRIAKTEKRPVVISEIKQIF